MSPVYPNSNYNQGILGEQMFSGDPLSVLPDMTIEPQQQIESPSSGFDVVSRLILSSSLYLEAEKILSADKEYGISYLSLLRMIPYGQSVRDENFWDRFSNLFGATSGYEEAVTDAFNAAMDEIRTLMQDYYSFLSRLPSEQVDQLRDAGINAAITGVGVTTSGMTSPDPSGMVTPNTPQSEYRNTSLSDGITSFVEFIGSMANLGSFAVNSKNILGLLDIAEREGYNKQETHDLLLAGLGVTTDSPYRVLDSDNTPAIGNISSAAQSDQLVKAAESGAAASALDSPISVNVGNNPNSVATYEIKTGADWLSEISRFQIANRFSNVMIQSLQSQGQQLFAGALSYLEGEYNMANFGSMIQESQFKSDFFSSRNGVLEGQNQTDLTTSLSEIRRCEAYVKSVESWMAEYRSNMIEHWGKQLEKRPALAPYFYKALFDFNMEDTFYHQNGGTMSLKYGLQGLDSISSFLTSLTGMKRSPAPKKVGQTTHTSGPKGDTITDTVFHYE